MTRWLVFFATLCLTAGCAQRVWVKPGATEQDFATDSYHCERDVRQSGYYGGGLIGAANMQEFFSRCMVAAGYRQQTVSPNQSSNSDPSEAFASDKMDAGCTAQANQSDRPFPNAYRDCMNSKGP
jgi:hypothetical protein